METQRETERPWDGVSGARCSNQRLDLPNNVRTCYGVMYYICTYQGYGVLQQN